MPETIIADVAVENTAYSFDREFRYLVPQPLAGEAKAGCRVMVPFGRGNRTRQGMILSVCRKEETEQLKSIAAVLDKAPLLTREMLLMVPWLSDRCFCTLFETVRLLLPVGINLKIQAEFSLLKRPDEWDGEPLSEEERRIVSYFSGQKKPVAAEKLSGALGLGPDSPVLEGLCKKGILNRKDGAAPKIGNSVQKMIRLKSGDLPEKLSAKQRDAVKLLQDAGAVSVKELCYFTGVTASVASTLVKKGIAEYYEEEKYRNPYEHIENPGAPDRITLSEEQQRAYENLLAQYRQGKGGVSLLYGVTGSGKTLVFLRLIDEVCASGRGVIVMVPEISLTPQTIAIFHRRYGCSVAVFHSGLSLGQRMDEWKRVKNGEALIAVGTRSAVFAPFSDIGLIILDEEQESTYKSESSPRYHARDVAKFRCAYHKALLLLCSATPSVESCYLAKAGRYSLNVLASRYGQAELPEVTVADMNEETQAGNTTVFSRVLRSALEENLERKEQSILLLNRRGYHTFASCTSCGHVITCPHCSISMTYHAANHRLMCHYCGYSIPFTERCPECGENTVRYSGLGTQRAEEQLGALFPQARILRLDTDSTMSRFSYEKKLNLFKQGQYDIMIGTQMVAKGLDFENVTLVGVLSADQSLYGDDFRGSERAFDLFTQVVGRSGRGKNVGRAVIQTYTPENRIIRLAAAQDYPSFYGEEIRFRRAMLYPPFADLILVGFIGLDEDRVCGASRAFLSLLRTMAQKEYADLPLRVLDPSPALVSKVSNKYRYKLIIKCRNNKRFREMLSRLLADFSGDRRYGDVTAFADSNPNTIM